MIIPGVRRALGLLSLAALLSCGSDARLECGGVGSPGECQGNCVWDYRLGGRCRTLCEGDEDCGEGETCSLGIIDIAPLEGRTEEICISVQ